MAGDLPHLAACRPLKTEAAASVWARLRLRKSRVNPKITNVGDTQKLQEGRVGNRSDFMLQG